MSWRARPAGTAAARASAPRGAPPSAAFPARPLSALMFPPALCARHCRCDKPGHGGSQGWRNTEGAELHSRPRCHPRPGPLNPRWRLQDASVRTLSCRIVRPLALQASRAAAAQQRGGSRGPPVSRAGLRASHPQPHPGPGSAWWPRPSDARNAVPVPSPEGP